MRRNTSKRDRHRAIIAKTGAPCALCGEPIDYSLRYPDPDSFVVDHVVPLNRGGDDVLANKTASHNRCNRLKSDRADGGPTIRVSDFFR